MKMFLSQWAERSTILVQARQAKFKPSAWVLVPMLLLIYCVASIISTIVALPFVLAPMLHTGFDINELAANLRDSGLYLNLFLTIPMTAVFIFYMKRIEGRSYHSMGFTSKGAVGKYLRGFGYGILMCFVAVGICLATGNMQFDGFSMNVNTGVLLLCFVGFLFQGMSEEVICRGFLMVSMANRAPLWVGVGVNSMIFAIFHLANDGITALSFVNLILYGLFASFYFLRTDNIWGIGALHSAWNFFQGNGFGIEVSGNVVNDTLAKVSATEGGNELINGGKFGLEGGLATTIVFVAGILILILWPRKSENNIVNKTEPEVYSVS